MGCSTCINRWFGNHAHPGFAQWHCRIGKKIVVIGKDGSDAELLAAKGCKKDHIHRYSPTTSALGG